MNQPGLTRFYFHLQRETLVEDPEGSDLPDLAAARAFALDAARDLWAEAVTSGSDLCTHGFRITNAGGDCLAVVSFSEALPVGLQRCLGLIDPSASAAES